MNRLYLWYELLYNQWKFILAIKNIYPNRYIPKKNIVYQPKKRIPLKCMDILMYYALHNNSDHMIDHLYVFARVKYQLMLHN